MIAPVRIALVGCGRIARGRHLPILNNSRLFEVAALVDPDASALDAAGTSAARAARYTSFSEIPAGTVEAVLIASPTPLHTAHALEAFGRGLHAYIEKPLATTLADADRVAEAWRKSGRVGMVGFNYRFHPMLVEAQRLLTRGQIGRLVCSRSVFSTPGREHPEWKRRRSSGGGVLLDLATHQVDSVRFLTGLSVSAARGWIESRRTEHDTAGLELTLDGGVIAQIMVAMSAVDEDRIEIMGENGELVLDRVANGRLHQRPATRAGLRRRNLIAALRACGPQSWRSGKTEISTVRAIEHFAACVRGKATASPDIDDGIASLRVVLAAEADALSRGPRITGTTGGAAAPGPVAMRPPSP